MNIYRLFLSALALAAIPAFGQNATIFVDAAKPGPRINPSLYGIFFEEINHSGDGGLYAELLQGGTFEENKTKGWTLETAGGAQGRMTVDTERPLNPAQQRSLRVEAVSGNVTAVNGGYWGIGLKQSAKYRFSFYARCAGGFKGDLDARLEGAGGKLYAAAKLKGVGADWKRFETILESSSTDPTARLAITIPAPGTLWLDVVSLFPHDTWKGRPNGMRPDLAEKMLGLKPAFMRFPGGCFVEGGGYVRDAFRWKNTLGDMSQRPGHLNATWNYWTNDGLGYHEYLQLSEDLGAEPLFVVNVGMAHREVVPMDQLQEWVDEALDAIEYANGPVTSKWGGLRAKNGHPKPFNLKYLEIGNENSGPNYKERYDVFYKAIKARYPYIVAIANAPIQSPMDIVDDHIYASAEWMRHQATHYDTYDRSKPKVFVGEYACNQDVGKGNLKGALAEAAYMIGFERNADVVQLSAYAPLFYHVSDRRWPVNLIGFDSATSFGTPSYWVQALFAKNVGDVALPTKATAGQEKISMAIERGGIGLATWNTKAEFKDVKVTQDDKILFASNFTNGAKDFRPVKGTWDVRDGAYQQTSLENDMRSMAGDAKWTDYTLSLKARKIAGAEGFIVMFRAKSNRDWFWLNLGGWGNSGTAIERSYRGAKSRVGETYPGKIETGRWYDVRVEVKGAAVRCFLDGKQIIHVENAFGDLTLPTMEAIANRADKTGEIVLKVVNFSKEPRKTAVTLAGVKSVAAEGTATVLSSASPEDENTIEQPLKVAPVTTKVTGLAPQFDYTFAPNSLTVLRLKSAR